MANWCWPEKEIKIFGVTLRPPHHVFFHASCNKHDDLYWEWGNEIDRKIADVYLLEYMKADIRNLQPWYKIPHFYIWAYVYYIAVRIGGKKHFNYITK